MSKISVNFDKTVGTIKPMHGVNNGPVKPLAEHTDGNLDLWIQAGIPYCRNHDASGCYTYGGEHVVDISAIFPNFDADVNDPASYDFLITDDYNNSILEGGTKIFYRLGNKIEHARKKYGTLPPKDFQKWAEICEHIIMHYNEGWADGFHLGIEYWEIWNEPDLDPDDAKDKRTWGGTEAQFYDLYETAAKHLKKRFPNLKIGGPAVAFRMDWADRFLCEMSKRNVTIDFFSWHIYAYEVDHVIRRAETVREMLIKYGYPDAESILNEWNYARHTFAESKQHVITIKGAAFNAASMLEAQRTQTIDMMMYYDATPGSTLNGIFEFYSFGPLKTYYSIRMFNTLYKQGTAVEVQTENDNIFAAASKDADGNTAVMFAYFIDEEAPDKTVELNLQGGADEYELYLLDKNHDCVKMETIGAKTSVTMKNESVILLKSQKRQLCL